MLQKIKQSFAFVKHPRHIDATIQQLKTKPAAYWQKKGEQMMVRLFQYASATVPAYKMYLKQHKIKPKTIQTIGDYKTVPKMDKNQYAKAFDYQDLFPYTKMTGVEVFSATSGSTGIPFYFPRGKAQEDQNGYIAETFFKNQFDIADKSTFVVIGFGYGIWIGGLILHRCVQIMANKGYSLSILPVGTNKELFITSVKRFAHLYDQLLLIGYPPFLKDIIDEGIDEGIHWKKYHIKMVTAAEAYNEDFRDYIIERTGIQSPLTDMVNIYGSVELGIMAHETALTNLIRRIACKNSKVFERIFPGSSRLPTLAQYYPHITNFEEQDGELLATGHNSSIPLLRYHFPDKGLVIGFEEMVATLKTAGVDIWEEAKKQGISQLIMTLPFVAVYERTDLAASLVGFLVYPEYIKSALQKQDVATSITGKFTMITKTDDQQNQYLEINVEMKKGKNVSEELSGRIQASVIESMLQKSLEYHHLFSSGSAKYKKQLTPHIRLWDYEYPEFFKVGIKQKWVIKK